MQLFQSTYQRMFSHVAVSYKRINDSGDRPQATGPNIAEVATLQTKMAATDAPTIKEVQSSC